MIIIDRYKWKMNKTRLHWIAAKYLLRDGNHLFYEIASQGELIILKFEMNEIV